MVNVFIGPTTHIVHISVTLFGCDFGSSTASGKLIYSCRIISSDVCASFVCKRIPYKRHMRRRAVVECRHDAYTYACNVKQITFRSFVSSPVCLLPHTHTRTALSVSCPFSLSLMTIYLVIFDLVYVQRQTIKIKLQII